MSNFFKSLKTQPFKVRQQLMWLGIGLGLFLVFLIFLADLKMDLSRAWQEKPLTPVAKEPLPQEQPTPTVWGALRASLSEFWPSSPEAKQSPQLPTRSSKDKDQEKNLPSGDSFLLPKLPGIQD